MTTIGLLGCIVRKLNEALTELQAIKANQAVIIGTQQQQGATLQQQGAKLADVQLMVESIDKAVEEPTTAASMVMTIA